MSARWKRIKSWKTLAVIFLLSTALLHYRIEQEVPDNVPEGVQLHPGPPEPLTYFAMFCTVLSATLTVKMYFESSDRGKLLLTENSSKSEEESAQKELDEFD